MTYRSIKAETYTLAPATEVQGDGDEQRGVFPGLLGRSEADPLALADGSSAPSVRCSVCAHRCLIRPGRRGICGVRANHGGRLVSLVYGEAVAAQLEPIEKKPLFHVHPGSLAYSISTRGCNFHCRFCQNWEIAQADREGLRPRAEHLPPEVVVARALAAGARSIAYTYVEPAVFLEYALDTARLARQAGLANVFVTNGYETPEAIDLMAPLIDAANVDLKGFDDAFYRRVCGARLEPVKEALLEMRAAGIWLEVTTLLIPGLNDGRAEIGALVEWLVASLGPDTPWHVSRFFPAHRLSATPPTPISTLRLAASLGRRAGLRHVYLGNAGEFDEIDTRCPGCGSPLIERRDYRARVVGLQDGRCVRCGRELAGVGLSPSGDVAPASVSDDLLETPA